MELLLKSEVVASCSLPSPSLQAEDVVDAWHPLKTGTEDQGSVHLRISYSLTRESGHRFRLAKDDQSHLNFLLSPSRSPLKQGDLLVFEGHGLVPALSKGLNNTPATSLGLVVELENRFTREPELYVAELTRNHDGHPDAFLRTAHPGLALFPLWVRPPPHPLRVSPSP